MKVWYIQAKGSQRKWSRNGWATVNSLPDLYKTKKAAESQAFGSGKCGYMWREGYYPIEPEVCKGELCLNK